MISRRKFKCDGKGKEYIKLTDTESGLAISGWCRTFTQKDEYKLLTALKTLIEEFQE